MDAPVRPERVSVLIAEDSRIQAEILTNNLTASGFDVRGAENGAIALEKIREQRPTLIISDIEMPQMTGYELCSAVKSDPDLKTIPFILLSTLSEPQDIIRGLHCGADNYVTKPYDPMFLVSRIESLLATPLGDDGDTQQLDVTLAGTRYSVNAGRQQVLNLLVSTFENAVEKNNELIQSNQELTLAREQLTLWNQKLEAANDRMTRDLNAAAKIQQSLLPTADPQTERVRFTWKYIPCDELAGDFLNFFALDDRHLAVFVVDVSGHGVASSLLSVTIARFLSPDASSSSLLVKNGNGTGRTIVSPIEVARELNRRFPMTDENILYFTMSYGVLDLQTLEFRYVLAGHPPPIHVPRAGTPKLLDGNGMAIGWVEDIVCEEQIIQLEPGDRIYLYSDGIPEAMNRDQKEFGSRQMLEVIELGKPKSLGDNVSLLLDAVGRWNGDGGFKDDVSILGLEIVGD